MIKKIPAASLRVGMFVEELDCDWLSHPFLRSRFKVMSDEQVEKVIEAGIHHVYIDTDRGLDAPDAPTEDEVRQSLHAEMVQMAARPPARHLRTTVAEELDRAQDIRGNAQRLVRGVMHDARLGRAVELDRVAPMVEEVTASILRNGGALIGLLKIRDKDDYTFLHCVAVCTLMVAFCRALGLDPETTRLAGMGGLLHDTGKAVVPDEILNKPGRLTEEEYEIIKRHPRDGHDILRRTPGIHAIPLEITLHHHERMDGKGYPDGLPPEQISQLVRMSSIVDVYDAITSDRCYHRGMPATDALRKLHEWSDFHFDPQLVQAFIRCVGIYPVGALVLLESGKLGVVIEQHEQSLLTPVVRVVFNTRTGNRIDPYLLDLSRPMGSGGADRIVQHEDPLKWKIDPGTYLMRSAKVR